jgi:hypothetical protein
MQGSMEKRIGLWIGGAGSERRRVWNSRVVSSGSGSDPRWEGPWSAAVKEKGGYCNISLSAQGGKSRRGDERMEVGSKRGR